MSITSIFARLAGAGGRKTAETISYDALFKGSSGAPAASGDAGDNYLPGLRHLENDVDSYFKDVFHGPVF